jgi:hypothetical protein
MAKVNVFPQEARGRHSGVTHPEAEKVVDARHDPKPQKAAMGDRRASTYQEK